MRDRIMMAAMEELNETGIKFTMMDIATRLSISKTTLYAQFKSKEDLIDAIVDSMTEDVHRQDEEILNNTVLGIPEKMKAIFSNQPRNLLPISNNFILALKRQFPDQWRKTQQFREIKWDRIETLLVQGMKSGHFRSVDLTITKVIFTSTVNELLNPTFLAQNSFTFKEAVAKMADILYFGLTDFRGSKQ